MLIDFFFFRGKEEEKERHQVIASSIFPNWELNPQHFWRMG